MEIEVEEHEVKFQFSNLWYEVGGTVVHHVEPEDVGIGDYEYQGARECQTDIAYFSEYIKAEFSNLSLTHRDTQEEVKEPSKYLLEAAKEALFSATQQKAEQEASECYE
jgi:hypothetical protein